MWRRRRRRGIVTLHASCEPLGDVGGKLAVGEYLLGLLDGGLEGDRLALKPQVQDETRAWRRGDGVTTDR